MKQLPYFQHLKALTTYIDGEVIWTNDAPARVRGKRVGTIHNGYLSTIVRPNGLPASKVRLHRYIYWLFNGDYDEVMLIDHINGNKGDNRIENLRMADMCQNQWNRGVCTLSRTGTKNVFHYRHGQYGVHMESRGIKYNKVGFSNIEEAAKYADRLRQELHGDFAKS